MKKLMLELLDYFILMAEIHDLRTKKSQAVQKQNFIDAANFRDEEKKLMEKIPTIEDLKQLREDIVKSK